MIALGFTAAIAVLASCGRDAPTAVDRTATRSAPSPTDRASLVAAPWLGGQFLLSPTGLDFGEVQVGTAPSTQTVLVTNVGKAASVVSMIGGAADGFGGSQDCQGRTIDVGASCQITYAFAPRTAGDTATSASGMINGVKFEIDLKGRGVAPRFRMSATTLDFGDVLVGASSQQSITVTNAGLAPVVVSTAVDAAAPYGVSQDCQGRSLVVGGSCRVTYTFSPPAPGPMAQQAQVNINGQTFWFALSGNGLAPSFRVTPAALDFGEVVVGQNIQGTVNVTNTSPGPVTVSMTGGGATPRFGGSQNCQARTLAAGASCQLTYTFAPTALGGSAEQVNGTINGQTFWVGLSGTGIASASARTAQFLIARTQLDFGNVQVGATLQQTIDVINVGAGPVTISMFGGGAGPFGGSQNCQGQTIAPAASCQITYTFAPTAAGVVTAGTNGTINGQPFTFGFRGTGVMPRLRVTPTAVDFGPLQVGSSLSQVVTVTNVGTDATVISMTGGAAGAFGGAQNCQGQMLAVGASCQITYTFAPTAPGLVRASTNGTINGQPFAFNLSGEGLAPHFRITPFAFDFGPKAVGTSSQQVVTMTNDGVAPAAVSMVGGAAGSFGGAQNCQGQTLGVGASCQIVYTFAPTAAGLMSATTNGTIDGQPFAFTMYGTGRQVFSVIGTALGSSSVAKPIGTIRGAVP